MTENVNTRVILVQVKELGANVIGGLNALDSNMFIISTGLVQVKLQ